MSGGFTFILIAVAELIVLFRLGLRDFLIWAELRHDAVYRVPHGDWPHVPLIDSPTDFHARGVNDA